MAPVDPERAGASPPGLASDPIADAASDVGVLLAESQDPDVKSLDWSMILKIAQAVFSALAANCPTTTPEELRMLARRSTARSERVLRRACRESVEAQNGRGLKLGLFKRWKLAEEVEDAITQFGRDAGVDRLTAIKAAVVGSQDA